jgi:acetyl-CoA acetyltransferase
MSGGNQIPIIVGVGDIKNKSVKLEDAFEPLELMLKSIRVAIEDAGTAESALKELQSSIDSIGIVATWTWPYSDLPGLLSEKLGVRPKHKHYTEHGGNQPAKLLDEAARRISLGESKVALVTGGEALASRESCPQFNTTIAEKRHD